MKNYQNTNCTNAITKTCPPPGPLSHGGASAIRTLSGSLSTVPRHLLPSKALSTGRGASRRRQTFVTASGSSLLAAAPPRRRGSAGRSLDSTSYRYLLGRERSLWATLGPSRFQCPREPLSYPGWGPWLLWSPPSSAKTVTPSQPGPASLSATGTVSLTRRLSRSDC